jgi:arabinogalactan endo-1,4-beta-galactosidase
VEDTAFVGIIAEALNAQTYKTMVPALYEVALKTRYLRDEESKAILDIILNGSIVDWGYIYDNFMGGSSVMYDVPGVGSKNFESYWDAIQRRLNKNMDNILKIYDNLVVNCESRVKIMTKKGTRIKQT